MKKSLLFLSVLSLVLVGCSTKREYFVPAENSISAEVSYQGSLPSTITDVTIEGATLKNGEVITKKGLNSTLKLSKDERFLGEYNGKFIVSNLDGKLKVLDSNNNPYFEFKFPTRPLSATIKGDDIAVITSENVAYLIDMKSSTLRMQAPSDSAYSVDSRIGAPYFMGELVIYPMLDGKLLIASLPYAKIIRSIIISSEPFFNNIIFFHVEGETIYAATATRLVAISQSGSKNFTAQIKDLLMTPTGIYVFLKDGTVELLNKELVSVKKRVFDFAIFSSVCAKDGYVYAIEKTGYLLKINSDLSDAKIYTLGGGEIEDKSFSANGVFYHADKYLKF